MQKQIDLNKFKENPQFFFSQLPKNAEVEIVEFLNFLMFKYNIVLDFPEKKEAFKKFVKTPISVENEIKISREELHER